MDCRKICKFRKNVFSSNTQNSIECLSPYRDSRNVGNGLLLMVSFLWTSLGYFLLRNAYFGFVPYRFGDGHGAVDPDWIYSVQGTYQMACPEFQSRCHCVQSTRRSFGSWFQRSFLCPLHISSMSTFLQRWNLSPSLVFKGVCYLLYPFSSNFRGSWGILSREEFKARHCGWGYLQLWLWLFSQNCNDSFENDALCILFLLSIVELLVFLIFVLVSSLW